MYPTWTYAAVGSGVVGSESGDVVTVGGPAESRSALLLLFLTLFTLHYRQRDEVTDKRLQYWRQQSLLHNEIMLVKDGNGSTISLPYLDSPKSSVFKESMSMASGESQIPMLPKESDGMSARSPLGNESTPANKGFFTRMQNVF